MKIAIGVTYTAPQNEEEGAIYRATANETLARAAGREVTKVIPPVHRVSPGEQRLPSHLTLPGLDYVAEVVCFVFSGEELKKLLVEARYGESEVAVILDRINQEGL